MFSGCYFKLARYFWPVNERTSHVSRKSVLLGMIMPFPSAGNSSSPAYQHEKKSNIRVRWIISTSRNYLKIWVSEWSWRSWLMFVVGWDGWNEQLVPTEKSSIFKKICLLGLCPQAEEGQALLCASGRWHDGGTKIYLTWVERERRKIGTKVVCTFDSW